MLQTHDRYMAVLYSILCFNGYEIELNQNKYSVKDNIVIKESGHLRLQGGHWKALLIVLLGHDNFLENISEDGNH